MCQNRNKVTGQVLFVAGQSQKSRENSHVALLGAKLRLAATTNVRRIKYEIRAQKLAAVEEAGLAFDHRCQLRYHLAIQFRKGINRRVVIPQRFVVVVLVEEVSDVDKREPRVARDGAPSSRH